MKGVLYKAINILSPILQKTSFMCRHAAAQSIQTRFCNENGETTYLPSTSESIYQAMKIYRDIIQTFEDNV